MVAFPKLLVVSMMTSVLLLQLSSSSCARIPDRLDDLVGNNNNDNRDDDDDDDDKNKNKPVPIPTASSHPGNNPPSIDSTANPRTPSTDNHSPDSPTMIPAAQAPSSARSSRTGATAAPTPSHHRSPNHPTNGPSAVESSSSSPSSSTTENPTGDDITDTVSPSAPSSVLPTTDGPGVGVATPASGDEARDGGPHQHRDDEYHEKKKATVIVSASLLAAWGSVAVLVFGVRHRADRRSWERSTAANHPLV